MGVYTQSLATLNKTKQIAHDLRFFERQKKERQFFTRLEKGVIMNTLLRQAQRDIRSLKKNDSYYGKTEISIYLDFSRHPDETKRLVGYSEFLKSAGDENENQSNLQSSLHPNSIVTEPIIEEPFLLCRTKVTKLQEKNLLSK